MKMMMKLLARAALSRPDAALVKAAGGVARVVRGRTLDARFQFLEAQARKQTPPADFGPEIARGQTNQLVYLFGGKPEPGVSWSDRDIPAPGRTISVRIYRPSGQNAAVPAIVYYHFGGGVVGEIGTCHAFCTMLAAAARTAVVSVGYRLAPEHRFPAGLDDAREAFAWTLANAESLGAAPGKAAVGGDSMGGNFSAIVALERVRDGLPAPVLQLLIYPATDLAAEDAAMRDFGDAFPLSKDTMAWFMSQYLTEGLDMKDPALSPLHAPSHAGLPPALIYTAGFDPLSDQGAAYAEKLKTAGVEVSFHCFERLAHAFTAFTGAIPAADEACRRIARETADRLARI